jgi:hypothetical protein
MRVCEASNQAAWYKTFLEELGYEVASPIPLHCDNKGAVYLALNPVTGRCSKHIAIKHHAIREYVEAEVIDLVRTPTGERCWQMALQSLCLVHLLTSWSVV